MFDELKEVKYFTGLYIGLRTYKNFQSEAKVEQIIAIVATRSVSCSFLLRWYMYLSFQN